MNGKLIFTEFEKIREVLKGDQEAVAEYQEFVNDKTLSEYGREMAQRTIDELEI